MQQGLHKGEERALGEVERRALQQGLHRGERKILDPKNARHIFRDSGGHVVHDTLTKRKLFEKVANDPACYLGPDCHGSTWFGKMMPDGNQIWVRCRGNKITNAGINETARTYNPITGLCALKPPRK